ncbi:type II toxin-antitoxin system VapC family toxin [Polaromonas sp. P1(28)-13]|nr:type II toxin-antitoxin system VapC family toxin [Polaromonas sp. P1(28)-13]
MIGLDTNVLVRYIMQDDAKQSKLASRLIESLTVEEPGFFPLVAVIELVWVLSSSFELVRAQVVSALEVLLQTKEIQVERAEVVWRAVRVYRGSSADFADCLVERSAAGAGCVRTMTFDRGAAKNCSMMLIQ